MAQHMRDDASRWLDMELPAQGGRTPKAAADPTRREDLQQHLVSFDAMPSQPSSQPGPPAGAARAVNWPP
jgi:hypothetical protein